MSKPLDFEFYVGGLEAAILHRLKYGNPAVSQPAMTGVKSFGVYNGQFSRSALLSELKTSAAKLPIVRVAYGSGKDEPVAGTGNLYGEQIELKHKHGFVVLIACNNIAPHTTRAYKMIAEVRGLLSGVQFQANVADAGEPEELEMLNHSPLMPAGVETVARLSDLTAYAVSFTTSFTEKTPIRDVESVGTADEILLDIYVNQQDIAPEFNTPGVVGGEKL